MHFASRLNEKARIMDQTSIKPPPVCKTVRVNTAPARAFALFTGRMGDWWPKTHQLGDAPFKEIIVEPRVGGRWFERDAAGVEMQWGKVLVWEAPERVVLAWQLDADWRYDPALITEVEVRFTPEAGGATRVDLEHRGLERFGARAEDTSKALDSSNGWSGILASFKELTT